MKVVLLHAFPFDHRMWAYQEAGLRAAGYDVAAPDLPGFGDVPLIAGEPSLGAVAAVVEGEYLDESSVVVGLSLGGYVAMELLRRCPERLAGVMLLDTKADADSPEAVKNRLRIAASADTDPDNLGRLLVSAMLPSLLAPESSASEVVREWLMQAPPLTVAWYQEAMAARPASFDVLADFAGPSLVLWGAQDAVSPHSDQRAMLEVLRQPQEAVIEDAGHLSAVEQPEMVLAAMVHALQLWGV